MNETKLTIRVSHQVLEGAKRYAHHNRTTLTRLVTEYLRQLDVEEDLLSDAPIVRRLSGTLSPDVNVEDYQKHLEKKYGAGDASTL